MLTAILCPECGYARRPEDTAPEGRCPSCGAAYEESAVKTPGLLSPKAASPPPIRVKGDATQHGSVEKFYGVGAVAYFFAFVYGAIAWNIFRSPKVWIAAAAIAMAGALYAWARSYRVKRAILDVPTSNVRSAAQGYAEIQGTVEPLDDRTLEGPLTRAPCVWYSYAVTERRKKRGDERNIDARTAALPFLLNDGTGTCLIEPAEACLICDTVAWRTEGTRAYYEWSIRPGDTVYAIGLFSSDARAWGGVAKDGMARLRLWLRDPKSFFARFDANRDGKVSRAELDAASAAARLAAMESHIAQGGSHRLGPTGDSRPFIVATGPHSDVAGQFGFESAFHGAALGVWALVMLFCLFYFKW